MPVAPPPAAGDLPPLSSLERVVLRARPDADLRLYCLPPAGAGPEFFHSWQRLLPPSVEPCSVSLPGRGPRSGEPSVTDSVQFAARLAHILDDPGDPRPYAVFGHSCGALLAFEAVRRLRGSSGRMPFLLALSSMAAPHLGTYATALPCRLIAGLDGLTDLVGPVPEQLLENHQLLAAACTPVLADLLLLLQHHHRDEPPLDVPLALYGGQDDPVTDPDALTAWNDLVTRPATPHYFPGGHMYPTAQAPALVGRLLDDLSAAIRDTATPDPATLDPATPDTPNGGRLLAFARP
ncbi:thioesterase domain-containing protein [Streptomyces sp. NPDC003038]|uniref:thioesterase II family protein n=1 Tax=unclassified Streptomyces TaxID=2593676 RepID=UPI0033A2AE55